MPESENRDDLFEDLDKFFAPIRDVDWPDSEGEPVRPPAPTAGDTVVLEEDASRNAGKAPSGGSRSGSRARPRASGDDDDEPDPSALLEPGGVASDEDEDDISVDSFAQPPSAYVDLRGEGDDVEVELDESSAEEPPSVEALEAAADHFAESVRDEVSLDEPTTYATEPVVPGLDLDEDEDEDQDDAVVSPGRPASVRTVRVGPEGLGGPSWQEPTTVEVGTSDEGRPAGRDVPAAFLTGLILAALAIGSIAISSAAFAVVASVIVLWAQGEFYRALQKEHRQPATALGLVGGGLVMAAGYFRGEAAMLAVFALSVFATFLWYMATPSAHRKGTTFNIGLTVLGIAYIPLLAAYALALLEHTADGRALVLAVIALTFVYDTAAFVVGWWIGSRPLAPTISPKKSVEGALGATLVVIAVSVGAVASYVRPLDTFASSAALAVVVAVFAPLGDLAESLLKRDLGVKDMGTVLPGHGGVLDRIDSLLFVVPAAFLFLRLILA